MSSGAGLDTLSDPFSQLRVRFANAECNGFRCTPVRTAATVQLSIDPFPKRLLPRRPFPGDAALWACIPGCSCRRLTGMWWKDLPVNDHGGRGWKPRSTRKRLMRRYETQC